MENSSRLGVDPEDVVVPAIMTACNVFGNSLAITILLHLKFYGSPASNDAQGYTQDVQLSTDFRERPSTSEIVSLNPKRRTVKFGAFHTLVSLLAVLDLCGTLCTAPLTIILYVKTEHILHYGGRFICNYSAFMMMFFGFTTMTMVMIMSLERLLSIRHPYYYHRHASATKALCVAGIALIGTGFLCLLPSMGFGAVRPMFPYSWCFADWHATLIKDQVFNYLYATLGLVILFVTLICNAIVVNDLLKMKRMAFTRSSRRRKLSQETQMIIQLLAITIIFVVCWMPLMIRILANQLRIMISPEQDRIAVWLVAANPILDPWVYILFRKSVFRHTFRLVKKMRCLKVQKKTDCKVQPETPTKSILTSNF